MLIPVPDVDPEDIVVFEPLPGVCICTPLPVIVITEVAPDVLKLLAPWFNNCTDVELDKVRLLLLLSVTRLLTTTDPASTMAAVPVVEPVFKFRTVAELPLEENMACDPAKL